jgi:hypothetical protein
MDDILYPQLISYKPRTYTVPTLDTSTDGLQEVTTDQIITAFMALFPWLTDPICHNLLLAGGSLASVIQALSMNKEPTIGDIKDLDFFMVGFNPVSNIQERYDVAPPIISERARSKIETIITKIKQWYPDCSLIRTPYAITLTNGTYKFQIILATYTSPNQVLRSFDLGASKSGLYFTAPKPQFMTTEVGLYSLEHRVNSVHPKMHSSLYIHRLIKYWHRGYAIEFKNLQLDPSIVQIKLPYLTLQVDSIHDKRITGSIVTKPSIDRLVVGYDGNLDYKMNSDTSIALFVKNNKFLVAKVHASHFQTGEEAIAKSLLMHEISPIEVIYHLPNLYSEGKLDVEICKTLKDFDFKEFLKCYGHPELLNSYLTAVYYYPKAVEYTELYHTAYKEFCTFKILPFDPKLFVLESKSDEDWYGSYYDNRL